MRPNRRSRSIRAPPWPLTTSPGSTWRAIASSKMRCKLAQVASEQLHQEPAVNDTLGWIFVKKDMAGRAIPFLENAAKADPSNAEFRYHLGTATQGRRLVEGQT